jgi:hypothetical protein
MAIDGTHSSTHSCQTFSLSTTIDMSLDLHASMSDLAREIESEDFASW